MNTNNLPILHIGYGKTATTWFQKVFYPNITDIEFFDIQKVRKNLRKLWIEIDNSDEVLSSLQKTNKRLVICDESMIGNINYREHNVQILKKIFYPAQIIIFIRNQIDIYPSKYSQYIKSGGTATFQDFIFHDSKIFLGENLKYDKIISLYKELFGTSNVFVYLYEDFNNNFDAFIEIFCSNHNLHVKTNQKISKRVNISLSWTLLKIKRISNRFTRRQLIWTKIYSKRGFYFHVPLWFEMSALIFGFFNKHIINKTKPKMEELIGKKQTQFIKDYFAASNNKLITEHGLEKIKDYNYPL